MFELDPKLAKADQLIDEMQHWERVIAHAQAQQLKLFAEFAQLRRHADGRWDQYDFAELGMALCLSGAAADNRMGLALDLTLNLPETLAALDNGEIDLLRAKAIADATSPLTAEQAALVEQRVLPRAKEQNAPQLRQSCRRAVQRIDPEGAAARHAERRRERDVELLREEDAMAQLIDYLPAATAIAIYDKINHYALYAHTADDPRSAGERRADAFSDLLLGGLGDRDGGVPVRIHVTVGAGTLLGADEAPAELAGYGPIPASVARELSTEGTWRRLLTDPQSGLLLDYGRATYRPPAGLAGFVRARDPQCRFPGCIRPATACELDHRVPFPEGPTRADNLAPLCPRHHGFKTKKKWEVWCDQEGAYYWISPTGRRYIDPPQPIAEPVLVPESTTILSDIDDPPPF